MASRRKIPKREICCLFDVGRIAAFTDGQLLERSFEERQAATVKYTGLPDEFGRLMVELAESAPDDLVAIDAFWWCMANDRYGDAAGKTADIVLAHHGKSERMRRVCSTLWYYSCPLVDRMARTLIRENPDRDVQARARLALAKWLQKLADSYPDESKRTRSAAEAEALLDEVISRYGEMEDPNLGHTLADTARAARDELHNITVGKQAPEIEGKDADGEPLKLSDYRGKVVLLNFCGDWCGPCRGLYPQNRAVVEQLKGRPFAFLGVSSDATLATLKNTIAAGDITWRCWWDGGTEGPIQRRWNIRQWPSIIILDHRGVIRYKGDVYSDKKKQLQAIEWLLKEAASGAKD